MLVIFFCFVGIYPSYSDTSDLINPFRPLFDKVKENSNNSKPKPSTSPEKSDFDQLRLTAILGYEDKKFALAEDNSGRGYIIEKGAKIGNDSIKIVDILSDAIVIADSDGKEKKIMLRKEKESR